MMEELLDILETSAMTRNSVTPSYLAGNVLDSMSYDLVKEHRTGDENHAGKEHLDAEDHNDDEPNAPANIGSIAFTYDADGNMTSEVDTNTSDGTTKTTTYAYNERDQLVSVVMPDGTYAEYKYDVYGKRREKKVCTDNTCATVTKWRRYHANF